MSKMTQEIIECLYKAGRAVYNGDCAVNGYVKNIVERFPGLISDSSAEFYIGLYSSLVSGEGSTWNQNSDLLKYYVEQIAAEWGQDVGSNALTGGLRFARNKSRDFLIKDLMEIGEKYGLEDRGNVVEIVAEQSGDVATETSGIENVEIDKAVSGIKQYISNKGFTYPDGLIENFYLSLKSKPFAILAGTSGTGKTRLAKLFAEAMDADYHMVPVRPDWSDGSDLFGHADLNGNFVEGPVCDAFSSAKAHPDRPVFLCLDEMNLARVEYYFSDFLSVIESRDKLPDGHIVTDRIDRYADGIPDNLYIVGTVNMDETTFPFSRKVLDRANTIEFSYVDLKPSFKSVSVQNVHKLKLNNSFLKSNYLVLNRDCSTANEYVTEKCAELQKLNEILLKANTHVGYRVRDEIVFYLLNNKDSGNLLLEDDAMDFEIMQKILPRIQGSSSAIRKMLFELYEFCYGNISPIDKTREDIGSQMAEAAGDAKYKQSARKIGYMMTRFEEDGFTSYWL